MILIIFSYLFNRFFPKEPVVEKPNIQFFIESPITQSQVLTLSEETLPILEIPKNIPPISEEKKDIIEEKIKNKKPKPISPPKKEQQIFNEPILKTPPKTKSHSSLIPKEEPKKYRDKIPSGRDIFRPPRRRYNNEQNTFRTSQGKQKDHFSINDILSLKHNPQPKTIWVFAPHPDDEVLCCGQTISELIKEGEKVKILFMTDGDALRSKPHKAIAYGIERRKESIAAAKELGLKKTDLFFLNFPDSQMVEDFTTTIQSTYTQQKKTSKNAFFPGINYTLDQLRDKTQYILELIPPKRIIIPHPEKEQHTDHRIFGKIALDIAQKMNPKPLVSQYIIHTSKIDFLNKTPNQRKLKLIRLFKTQRNSKYNIQFLENFAKKSEVFIPYIWKNSSQDLSNEANIE